MTLGMFLKGVMYAMRYQLRRLYRALVRPATRGVGCLVEHEGKFLLIRTLYDRGVWTTPGGFVEVGEDFEKAATREVFEETGILVQNPVRIGAYERPHGRHQDHIELYFGRSATNVFEIDPFEVKEAAWFSRNEFPENLHERVREIVAHYDEYCHSRNTL